MSVFVHGKSFRKKKKKKKKKGLKLSYLKILLGADPDPNLGAGRAMPSQGPKVSKFGHLDAIKMLLPSQLFSQLYLNFANVLFLSRYTLLRQGL